MAGIVDRHRRKSRAAAKGTRAPFSSPSLRVEEPKANQGTGQVEQPLEQIGPPRGAHAQATATEEPSKTTLHHPTNGAFMTQERRINS